MTTTPAPGWLYHARDRYVAENDLLHMLPELYDWGYRGQYSMAREGLVHHLAGVRESLATWGMIAQCVGAGGHASVIDANTRYRHRVLALGVTP